MTTKEQDELAAGKIVKEHYNIPAYFELPTDWDEDIDLVKLAIAHERKRQSERVGGLVKLLKLISAWTEGDITFIAMRDDIHEVLQQFEFEEATK